MFSGGDVVFAAEEWGDVFVKYVIVVSIWDYYFVIISLEKVCILVVTMIVVEIWSMNGWICVQRQKVLDKSKKSCCVVIINVARAPDKGW